jgi:hypothetical protein
MILAKMNTLQLKTSTAQWKTEKKKKQAFLFFDSIPPMWGDLIPASGPEIAFVVILFIYTITFY